MKNLLLVGFLSLIVIILGYIAIDQNQVRSKANEKTYSATLALYNGEASLLAFYAYDKGFFKDENLDITIKYYPTGKDAMKAMLEGKADYSNATDFVAVKNSFINPHFKILASMAKANINGMLGFQSHGIQKPADIKGKVVGTTIGTATEYYTGVFLEQNFLKLSDITLKNVAPSERIEVMKKGQVDALFAWEPAIYKLRQMYKEELNYFPMSVGFEFYFLLMADKKFHHDNPEISKRILRAMTKAEKEIALDKEAFKKYVQSILNYDNLYVEYTLGKHDFELSLPYTLTVSMQNQVNWLMSNNLVDTPEVEQSLIFDTSLLKEISPISVSILE